ncbi:MAG: hypothetical protein Pg6A_11660 [Termitinemataceae bacterium]|nr:MAG: hypothetical protein Pg6A_11660 [Termitinemataceae bacterium]
MVIEQTVEIPPLNGQSRRIYLEVPPYIPEGRVTITFSVSPASSSFQSAKSWRSYRGIFKDSDNTVSDFLGRMRADRELEDEIDKRRRSSGSGA